MNGKDNKKNPLLEIGKGLLFVLISIGCGIGAGALDSIERPISLKVLSIIVVAVIVGVGYSFVRRLIPTEKEEDEGTDSTKH